MIQVIIQGTIDGHRIFPSENRKALHDTERLDIRTEIASNFSLGYYIQMYSQGAWVSKAKSMDDGATMRAGYVAVSVYIPKHILISGSQIKEQLDRTLDHYLNTYTDGMSTTSIGVDWSFVTNASTELNALCQPRRKTIETHYTPSNNFAYVQATTEEKIIQLLDKPFQPEYGAYKAVFIGTDLQHPTCLPQQTCLNIDLENEVYDIQWNGNKHEWPDLPTKVRKKEIATGSYTFKKDYYNPTTIPYASGEPDDANTTLILDIPNLQPQINKITLQYSLPNANVVVGVTNLPAEQIKGSTLFFKGDEFTRTWEVYPVPLNDEYKFDKFLITPCNCPNNICFITITKMQQISLQILDHGGNKTMKYKDNKIRIISKLGRILYPYFNEQTSSLCLSIPENEEFAKDYSVSLIGEPYSLLDGLSEGQRGFYSINIQRKALNGKNEIEIPPTSPRSKNVAKQRDCNRRVMQRDKNGINNKAKLVFLGVGVVFLLSILVLLTLYLTGIINLNSRNYCTNDEGVHVASDHIESSKSSIDEIKRINNNLNNVLGIQRESWDYKIIHENVDNFGKNIEIIKTDPETYKLYKELVWMQCRNRLDGYTNPDRRGRYDDLNQWKSVIWTKGINGTYNECATPALKQLLYDMMESQNEGKLKQFFNEYVHSKKIETMTYSQIKKCWDDIITGVNHGNSSAQKKNEQKKKQLHQQKPEENYILNAE